MTTETPTPTPERFVIKRDAEGDPIVVDLERGLVWPTFADATGLAERIVDALKSGQSSPHGSGYPLASYETLNGGPLT